jgi:hypothetical protein
MIERQYVNEVLSKFSKYVTTQAKANLTRKDKNTTSKLYNSIKGEVFTGKNSLGVYFEMEDYGKFQDLGVKGKTSSQKAPNSPYRFGTGSAKNEEGLRMVDHIEKWVRNRRFQFKDKQTGRFMSYEQTAYLVTRSVYNKGIEASRFFSKPFEVGFDKLPNDIIEAYGLDVEKFLKDSLK